MEELNEIESKKLDEYIVKTVHEDGRIDVNVDMKRMIDDLLGGNNKDTRNKIIKVTFIKSSAFHDPYGKYDETTVYLVNRSEEEIRKLFMDILEHEDEKRGDMNSNVKMSLRAYVIEEGEKYVERTEMGLTSVKGAELIDGRNNPRI